MDRVRHALISGLSEPCGGPVSGEHLTHVEQLASEAAEILATQSGQPFDFSLASLARLDALLAEWRDLNAVYGGPIPDHSPLIVPVAAYLGETLARAGAWWFDAATGDSHRPALVAVFPDGRHLDLIEAASIACQGVEGASLSAIASLLQCSGNRGNRAE